MGIFTHVEIEKKEFVCDLHRIARMEDWLLDSAEGSILVLNGSKYSTMVEVKVRKDSYPIWNKLKEAVQSQKVKIFS